MKLSIQDRTEAGSCNNCQSHETDKVVVVELGWMSFRLCRKCTLELAKELNRMILRFLCKKT